MESGIRTVALTKLYQYCGSRYSGGSGGLDQGGHLLYLGRLGPREIGYNPVFWRYPGIVIWRWVQWPQIVGWGVEEPLMDP